MTKMIFRKDNFRNLISECSSPIKNSSRTSSAKPFFLEKRVK